MKQALSTEASHLQACGARGVRLDPAKGLEAGLALAPTVLSVKSDLLALRPSMLPIHRPLAAPYHPSPHTPRHSSQRMDGAAWLTPTPIQAGENGDPPLVASDAPSTTEVPTFGHPPLPQ